MSISDAFLQEIKFRCDIESVVSRYVTLKKNGRALKGLCPFHSEKTPSFYVHPDEQFFYCFGCGAGGDIITFIMKIENLDYIEALKFLSEKAGIAFPDEQEDDGTTALRRKILEMNREAAKFFHDYLISPQGLKGLNYLKDRRLSMSTIKGFGLGYAPDKWDALLNHLKSEGYSEEEMRAAALVSKRKVEHSSTNENCYDQFRNRVIFPIIDVRGNVIAFGGRVLDNSMPEKHILPKYLNSADTAVFKKSRCLYALNKAKNGNNNTMILCEGYMDVIALHQAGFTNSIATLGTALAIEQARLISRYAKEVIISYDADVAGQNASQRAIGLLNEAGLSVKVLKIEGSKDPDEYIKTYGADKFRLMLEKSGSHIEYRLEQAKAKLDLAIPEQRVAYLKEAALILSTIESPIECEVYASKLAHELEVSIEAILTEVISIKKRSLISKDKSKLKNQLSVTGGIGDRINPEKSRNLKAAYAEESILVLLFHNPNYFEKLNAALQPEDFLTSFNRKVFENFLLQIAEYGDVNLSRLPAKFNADEIGKITIILVKRQVSNTWKEISDCVNIIKSQNSDKLLGNELDILYKMRKENEQEKKKTGGIF
jgi:DNA primase